MRFPARRLSGVEKRRRDSEKKEGKNPAGPRLLVLKQECSATHMRRTTIVGLLRASRDIASIPDHSAACIQDWSNWRQKRLREGTWDLGADKDT